MAKKTTGKTTPGKTAAGKTTAGKTIGAQAPILNPDEVAVRAALGIAAREGWNAVSMQRIAEETGMKFAELRDIAAGRLELLAAYNRMIDRQVLSGTAGFDKNAPPRDRLFDLMMERFDVLNRDADGVRAVVKGLKWEPGMAMLSLPHLACSMRWMLEAAGMDANGWHGRARTLGLAAIYLATLRQWINDESPDMAVTMAALDKYLGRAEQWADRVGLN